MQVLLRVGGTILGVGLSMNLFGVLGAEGRVRAAMISSRTGFPSASFPWRNLRQAAAGMPVIGCGTKVKRRLHPFLKV